MKILATKTAPFEFTPPADVDVVFFDPTEPVPAEHLDAEAAIVEGGGGAGISQLAREAHNLRWVQTLAAGPDGVLAAGFAPEVIVCNGRGLHSRTVAEAAVALALTGVLRFPEMLAAQRDRRWEHDEFGSWQLLRPEGRLTHVVGAEVVVWGFGAIGQQVARILQTMGANVRGVANSAGERSGFPVHTVAELPDILPSTDVLIMVLPTHPTTDKALNAERLALLPGHAWVVNVGRGSTMDEEALVDALTSGSIGGAALDVTATEPYPVDGPLWTTPNTVITPHMAGGVADGSDALINENIRRLKAGEQLRNAVAR